MFEAPYGGFCTTFSRSQDRFDRNELSAGLGERFETMGIAFKFYSCVGSNHTTLDAIRDIARRRPFAPDDVERIVVHGSQVTVDHVGWRYRPEGLTAAQLNLPFCVATLLLEGDVFVDQFAPEAVDAAARIALSRKVEVVHDPAITALGAGFRHRCASRCISATARWRPRRARRRAAASSRPRQRPFRKLTRAAMGAPQQGALIEAVLGLEKLEDAGQLARLLRMGLGEWRRAAPIRAGRSHVAVVLAKRARLCRARAEPGPVTTVGANVRTAAAYWIPALTRMIG